MVMHWWRCTGGGALVVVQWWWWWCREDDRREIAGQVRAVVGSKAAGMTEAYLVNLHRLLQSKEWMQEDCPICLDPLHEGVAQLTSCGHLFCKVC